MSLVHSNEGSTIVSPRTITHPKSAPGTSARGRAPLGQCSPKRPPWHHLKFKQFQIDENH